MSWFKSLQPFTVYAKCIIINNVGRVSSKEYEKESFQKEARPSLGPWVWLDSDQFNNP